MADPQPRILDVFLDFEDCIKLHRARRSMHDIMESYERQLQRPLGAGDLELVSNAAMLVGFLTAVHDEAATLRIIASLSQSGAQDHVDLIVRRIMKPIPTEPVHNGTIYWPVIDGDESPPIAA